VPSNGHAGFGGRPKETGWSKGQYRASGRPYVVLVHGTRADTEALREASLTCCNRWVYGFPKQRPTSCT
jgi:hypothetical protein